MRRCLGRFFQPGQGAPTGRRGDISGSAKHVSSRPHLGASKLVDARAWLTYQWLPKVFPELGAEVISIGCTDGLNGNHEVGYSPP